MNERIEELIIAYLHRGATPEQERELFQACSNDPDIAALLRRHLSLSLSLRQLRDTVEVPVELRNSLLGRINTLKPSPEPREHAMRFGIRAGVFNWRHVFGTALAGAALAAIGFLTFQPATVPGLASAVRTDTVRVVRTETVTQYRDVPKIVYVTRAPGTASPAASSENLAAAETPGPLAEKPAGALTAPTVPQPVAAKPIETPAIVKAGKADSFTEQYNVMLASLEKVSLTESDRVRN